jgi:DNA-binding transcriptional MocR family regulator
VNIAERWAWVRSVIAANPRPTLAEVAVATTLAEHHNDTRGAAWPAQRTIADLIRYRRRTVRSAIQALEARGLIRCLSPGGPRSSAEYALVMPPEGAPQRPQRAPYSAHRGRLSSPSEGAAQRPEQVSRSESVGTPYPAASARSAGASRARGGTAARKKAASPPTPLKL